MFYCTAAGSYFEHPIPLNERTRAAGIEVLQVIDRAVESGFPPPRRRRTRVTDAISARSAARTCFPA